MGCDLQLFCAVLKALEKRYGPRDIPAADWAKLNDIIDPLGRIEAFYKSLPVSPSRRKRGRKEQ